MFSRQVSNVTQRLLVAGKRLPSSGVTLKPLPAALILRPTSALTTTRFGSQVATQAARPPANDHHHHNSWMDAMDMTEAMDASKAVPLREVTAEMSDEDFWDIVAKVECDDDVEEILRSLGVKTPSDMAFVSESDLVKAGLSAVVARKLLAVGRSESKAVVMAATAPVAHPAPSQGIFSAEETMKLLAKKGVMTVQRPDIQILVASYLGGALLGWGCALTTVVAGGSSIFLADAPGLLSLLSGLCFPVGLSMIVLSGGELLTGNFMTMALPAFTHPGVSRAQVLLNTARIWGISGLGNFIGCISIAIATYALSVVVPGSAAAGWLTAMTVKKCSLSAPVIIGKAAGANWLVNVAIFQAASAHTSASKIASLYLPIMTFVALGLEHSVANMFLLPLGKWLGADVTYFDIISNIAPGAVGNAIGAIVFVAGLQRFALLRNLVYTKPVAK